MNIRALKTDVLVKWTLLFGFVAVTMTSYMLYTPPQLAAQRAAAAAHREAVRSEARDSAQLILGD